MARDGFITTEATADQESREGIDLDAVLRRLLKNHLVGGNRSIEEIAHSLQMDPKPIRSFMRGNSASLELLSRICAVSEFRVDELFALDEEYAEHTQIVIPRKQILLRLLGTVLSEAAIERLQEMAVLLSKVPSSREIVDRGYRSVLAECADQGYPVERHRAALARISEHHDRKWSDGGLG